MAIPFIYNEIGNDPVPWKLKAEELFYCSEGLQEFADTKCSTTYDFIEQANHQVKVAHVKMMLRGFGIECLIKAVFLKKGNTLYNDGGLDDTKKNHFLHKMIDEIGIKISKNERAALRQIGAASMSPGRYPLFPGCSYLVNKFGDGKDNFIQEWNEQTLEPAFLSLKGKLVDELNS